MAPSSRSEKHCNSLATTVNSNVKQTPKVLSCFDNTRYSGGIVLCIVVEGSCILGLADSDVGNLVATLQPLVNLWLEEVCDSVTYHIAQLFPPSCRYQP